MNEPPKLDQGKKGLELLVFPAVVVIIKGGMIQKLTCCRPGLSAAEIRALGLFY